MVTHKLDACPLPKRGVSGYVIARGYDLPLARQRTSESASPNNHDILTRFSVDIDAQLLASFYLIIAQI